MRQDFLEGLCFDPRSRVSALVQGFERRSPILPTRSVSQSHGSIFLHHVTVIRPCCHIPCSARLAHERSAARAPRHSAQEYRPQCRCRAGFQRQSFEERVYDDDGQRAKSCRRRKLRAATSGTLLCLQVNYIVILQSGGICSFGEKSWFFC